MSGSTLMLIAQNSHSSLYLDYEPKPVMCIGPIPDADKKIVRKTGRVDENGREVYIQELIVVVGYGPNCKVAPWSVW